MAPTRHCARCGGQNPAEAQFCIECGAGLESAATGPTVKLSGVNCPACGALNPERSQFCCICGRGLAQSRGRTQPLPGRQPRPRPHAPIGPPPQHQRSYPRVHWPPIPAPIPPAPLRQPQHSPLHSPAAVPLLVILALACLLMVKAVGPGLLVGFAMLAVVSGIFSQRMAGRVINIALLVMGILLVATTGFWPALLVLFFVRSRR